MKHFFHAPNLPVVAAEDVEAGIVNHPRVAEPGTRCVASRLVLGVGCLRLLVPCSSCGALGYLVGTACPTNEVVPVLIFLVVKEWFQIRSAWRDGLPSNLAQQTSAFPRMQIFALFNPQLTQYSCKEETHRQSPTQFLVKKWSQHNQTLIFHKTHPRRLHLPPCSRVEAELVEVVARRTLRRADQRIILPYI